MAFFLKIAKTNGLRRIERQFVEKVFSKVKHLDADFPSRILRPINTREAVGKAEGEQIAQAGFP